MCQYPGQLTGNNTPGPEIKTSPEASMSMHDVPQQQQPLPAHMHLQQSAYPPNLDNTSIGHGYTTPEPPAVRNHALPDSMHDDVSPQQQVNHGGPPAAFPSHSQPQPQPLPHLSHSNIHPQGRHNEYTSAMAVDSITVSATPQAPLDQAEQGHDPFVRTTISHGALSVTSVSTQSMRTRAGVSPSFSDEYYLAPDTSTFAGSLSAAGQLDFRGTGLDWLAFDVPEIFTPAEGVGLSGIDSTMTTQDQIQHFPQQQTAYPQPHPPPPPAPASHALAQNHRQYPGQYGPQSSSTQLDRTSNSQFSSYPPAPTNAHAQPSNPEQYTSPAPQNSVPPPYPGPSSAHLSYPPLPAATQSVPQTSHTTNGQVLPWPFEEGPHDQQPQRYSLPPLREVLQNNLLHSTNPAPSDKSVLANLVVLMSDTRVPGAPDGSDGRNGNSGGSRKGPGNSSDNGPTSGPSIPARIPPDPGMAHATSLLKKLVDTYITKFQPILPLLHLPTWDIATAPRVLVSAMACVGSLLEDDEHINGLTLSISDICMPMIAWMGSSDSANYRDISYLSALCVHQIYSLGSGNRQLYQNADRSRGILVGGLRGMGCLTTRLSLEDQAEQAAHASLTHGMLQQFQNGVSGTAPQTPTAGNPPSLTAALQEQWLSWMYREREKRTAWSSFEYDCSLCTLTGRRGAVDLSELPSRLPCAETLWDASSATAWAALRTRLHPDAQGALVSVVMRGALRDDSADSSSEHSSLPSLHSSTSTPNPHMKNQGVSFWGKRLCAQVIGRLLWDLKQLETLATSEYFGMPSLSTAQTANKVRLLRALDNLLVSMDQPTTVADLISYNIASLIGHYSHLYTAQDVLDIILYIVRNTVAHGAHRLRHHKGIQMAKRRLVATLSRDPQEARRLVYHAAQIVAVANDYLVSAPCEILRLFMGYTFLIVFAAYCPDGYRFQLPDTAASGVPSSGAIQLDIPSHRIASTADVDNWIAHGGPAAIGSVPNLFADGGALAICRDAQAIMQRLKNWGLAEKFTKILQNFESTALAELNA